MALVKTLVVNVARNSDRSNTAANRNHPSQTGSIVRTASRSIRIAPQYNFHSLHPILRCRASGLLNGTIESNTRSKLSCGIALAQLHLSTCVSNRGLGSSEVRALSLSKETEDALSLSPCLPPWVIGS